jgi:UDP-N-acetylglucosamine 2-epimerase (non-hydrolysing)
MSDIFFQQLGIPAPDINLEVGSGSHAVQTAQIMMRFEETVLKEKPEMVLVYGDINSTVAAALVCAKLGVKVGHVEAGLRSFDRAMPEEINRLMTDQIADILFTPSQDGDENLMHEGIKAEKIHFVGNVMIDTLVRLLPEADALWPKLSSDLQISEKQYGLVTLHRPSNVDDPDVLLHIIETLEEISEESPIVFPIHPRTRARIADSGRKMKTDGRLQLVEPIGYMDFLCLQKRAKLVITDSGGIQEETTFLGVPCLTVRENTERPVTVTMGTNTLVGQDMARLREETGRIMRGEARTGHIPPLWDGHAADRIAAILSNSFEAR